MNAITSQHNFAIAPPKRDWPKALRAMRRLLADKDDTVQVFEIMRALNGTATRDGYMRLLTTARGWRLAYHRRELTEVLNDRAALAKLPADSVAAHYLAFTERGRISAEGLAEVSRAVPGDGAGVQDGVDLVHPVAWFGRRVRDTHDLWHILTGYDLTALGEACLVAFSYAQTRALGWALIAVATALGGGRVPGQPFARATLEGYRRGRAAEWLPGEDYEALLAEPLNAAQARLGLAPPRVFDAIPVEARNRGLAKN